MSGAILGALSGAGPGFLAGQESQSKLKNERLTRDIAQATENRTQQKFDWDKMFSDIMSKRNQLQNPNAFEGGTGTPSGAPAPAIAPAEAPAALQGAAAVSPGMPPSGGALPATQPPAETQQPQSSYRDRYNQYYSEAARYATRVGGLEGYQKFQEMEDALNRRQMLGYGLQATQALDDGMVGEAARAGNAALEISPFDTGLKFVTHNGKLYLQGEDGSRSEEPLNGDSLRAFVDQKMKTPEQYLDWKAQYETERSNRENEKDTDARNAINARLASVQEQYAAQKQEELPYSIGLKSAQMYNLLMDSMVGEGDGSGGLTTSQWANLKKGLHKDILDTFTEGELGPAFSWMADLIVDPGLRDDIVSTAMDLATPENFIANNGNIADAISFSAWLASGDLKDPEARKLYRNRAPQAILNEADENGRYAVMYNGKPIFVTKDIWAQAMARRKNMEAVLPESE